MTLSDCSCPRSALVRIERKSRTGFASSELPFVLKGSAGTYDLPEEVAYSEDILGVMEYLVLNGWDFFCYDGKGPVFKRNVTIDPTGSDG